MKPGRFITLEGLDGAGKSTQAGLLQAHLAAAGQASIQTREPGGTPLAEALRNLLLTPGAEAVSPVTELLTIFAARCQHLDQVIRPALARGVWVISERFTDATYAYQGAGRGLPESDIKALERLVQQGLQPDLTLFLDLDPAQVAERMRQRNPSAEAADRFEREGIEFFARVRAGYLGRSRRCKHMCVVDAAASQAEVSRAVVAAANRLLAG